MIAFFKRLMRDPRGNALLIAGAALPVVIGAAGLATDSTQWVLWKRQLQRAADSGALAGAYAKSQSDSASSAVSADLVNNNQAKNLSGISLSTGYPQVTYPTSSSWSYGVKVTLAMTKRLSFSSLFMTNPPTITATATAALVDKGEYCVVALEKTTATGITIGGNTNTSLGCGAISNSRNQNSAVAANGSSYSFIADPVAAVGGLPGAITGVTTLRPFHTPMIDPYANKFSTAVPPGMPCKTFNQHASNGNTNPKTLTPGCFTSFNPNGNTTYNLQPGVYYLNNTDFQLNGNDSLRGTGVTIVLTGTAPGSVKVNGNSTVDLSAPTSSSCGVDSAGSNSCTYEKMLFIQAANASSNNGNTINGTNTSNYDGAVYFPNGQVSFTGNTADMTKCAMVVARQVVFSGNSNLQNNTTGCKANTKAPGKEVRLVA
ncbi:MAG: Tad domain-containing protein [Sphingomicrobium sp.]